jgi:hypothetical protein
VSEVQNYLPNAVDAPFNAYKRRNDPICLPNTRVELLNKINEWIHSHEQQLFWLNGLAGTGKSTIARTIARQCYDQDCLGASFFFSRNSGDVGTAEKFVTSIARQLASRSSALEEAICKSIQQHRDIASHSLSDQWHRLILQPLSQVNEPHQTSFVIVIDALDECDNNDDIMTILRLLAETQSYMLHLHQHCTTSAVLQVFLTSRPEAPIRQVFYNLPLGIHQDFILHEIQQETVDNDLSLFFTKSFEEIAIHHHLDADWPGQEVIQQLVNSASGLFIWAATAIRFIHDGNQFAYDRLSTILQSQSTGTMQQKSLDKIYLTVLTHSISPNYTEAEKSRYYSSLRYILGSIVILFSQLPLRSLGTLLGMTSQHIKMILKDFHAILAIPNHSVHETGDSHRTQGIRLHHPSFRDFLLDNQRCINPKLLVDERQAHQMLYNNCVRLMSDTLQQDICNLGAPGTLLQDIASSQVEQYLLPELQYACLYWVHHLLKSGWGVCDNDITHQFLKVHLLHWLEALSIIGKVSEGILMVNSLISLASVWLPIILI